MVKPLSLQQERKQRIFTADHSIGVLFVNSKYNSLWKPEKGKATPAYADLPAVYDDYKTMEATLAPFGITDHGKDDMYKMIDDGTLAKKRAVYKDINDRMQKQPDKKFLVVFLMACHGMSVESLQNCLFSQVSSTGFYAMWPIEAEVRARADCFHNSF